MALNLEAVPATPRKRDPAWKHCQIYKNGDNVHLRCIYCGKIFSGGGIHRVKEHLAGQKGNGSTCSRVEPDIRLEMQECLSAVVKNKKHKHGVELDTVDPSTSEIGNDQCGLNTEIELSPMCSQKRDPAWNHCQVCKDGDKVYLECIYCGKVFKGGGVYRVKEHLAGQKGNGSTCLRVQPDVRLAMQEYLNAGLMKSKKHKHTEEINTGEIGVLSDQCGLNTEAEWSSVSPQKRDPAWKHCQMYKDGDKVYLKCIYCGKVFKGGGIYRVKEHLAGQKGNGSTCLRVQPDVRVSMLERLNEVVMKRKKQKLADKMNTDDASTSGVAALSDQCWLNVEVESLQVPDMLEQNGSMFVSQEEGKNSKLPGRKTGNIRNVSPSGDATLLARPINQAVNSKRINNEVHMAIAWFLLDAGVPFEAVNSAYFQPMIDAIASQGVGVAGPSYHELRSWILNNSVQELKNEIDQCTGTWATTGCSVLSMVTSEEWIESPYSKKPKGSEVLDFISNQYFWSSCTLITRLTDPLLRLLRIVGSAKKPSMGYVYAGLYRAKETIKKELIDKEYSIYWNIIDHRWKHLRHHPLHASGFYLNPRFFYSTEEDVQHRIRSLVYDCVEKLAPDPNVQDKIVIETTAYQKAAGEFGRDMAVRARETLLPGDWWSAFSGGCPNLAQFATRILSQTCSLISGKPSRDLSERINRTTNCLEHRRLNDLVLVQSNLRLRGEMNRAQSHMDPIAYENIALAGDWVSGRELFPGELGCTDWTMVDPPLGNGVLSGPEIDDAEALGSGFKDHEVLDF
nr:hAT transposon superfamily [Ipomoea batatas]